MGLGERGREREREREAERERYTEKERDRDKQRERERGDGRRGRLVAPTITTYPLTAGVVGHHSDLTTSLLHFSLFSTALWDLANSRPVHCLNVFSHLFFCLPCLFPPFTVSRKMVLGRLGERERCPFHFSLRLFTIVRRSLCGPIACWIFAQTSSFVTWSSSMRCFVSCGSTSFP